jgi:hypothetical protein
MKSEVILGGVVGPVGLFLKKCAIEKGTQLEFLKFIIFYFFAGIFD